MARRSALKANAVARAEDEGGGDSCVTFVWLCVRFLAFARLVVWPGLRAQQYGGVEAGA
jgi:hypothetical protein